MYAIFVFIVLCLMPSLAYAKSIYAPLPVAQMNPVMMRFLDPIPESIPNNYHGKFSINQHYSSIFQADTLPAPSNYLADMELYVLDVASSYRWKQQSLHIHLPLLRPSAGFLDPFLRSYHQSLGFPNGGRKFRPDNDYTYQYRVAGGGWNNRARWETGNLSLQWRYSWDIAYGSWSVASALKIPTASAARGWSNGGSDIAMGVTGNWQKQQWYTHLEAWWIHPLKNHDLGSPINDYFRSNLTLGYAANWPFKNLLTVQLQGGSSPYHSGIAALDQPPWLVSFGLQIPSRHHHLWKLAFVENITQQSTQDFGLLLSYQIQY